MKLTLIIMALSLNSPIVWASGSCSHIFGGSSTTQENPIPKEEQPNLDSKVTYPTGLFEDAIEPSRGCILDGSKSSLTVQETVVRTLELIRKGTDADRLKIAIAMNNAHNVGLLLEPGSKVPDEVLIGIKIHANLTQQEDTKLQLALAKDQIDHQRVSNLSALALMEWNPPKSMIYYEDLFKGKDSSKYRKYMRELLEKRLDQKRME